MTNLNFLNLNSTEVTAGCFLELKRMLPKLKSWDVAYTDAYLEYDSSPHLSRAAMKNNENAIMVTPTTDKLQFKQNIWMKRRLYWRMLHNLIWVKVGWNKLRCPTSARPQYIHQYWNKNGQQMFGFDQICLDLTGSKWMSRQTFTVHPNFYCHWIGLKIWNDKIRVDHRKNWLSFGQGIPVMSGKINGCRVTILFFFIVNLLFNSNKTYFQSGQDSVVNPHDLDLPISSSCNPRMHIWPCVGWATNILFYESEWQNYHHNVITFAHTLITAWILIKLAPNSRVMG